jgi:hypothetical protein
VVIRFEYKTFRMIAEETPFGWTIKIAPKSGKPIRQTVTFRELSDAIDEAKKIVNASG